MIRKGIIISESLYATTRFHARGIGQSANSALAEQSYPISSVVASQEFSGQQTHPNIVPLQSNAVEPLIWNDTPALASALQPDEHMQLRAQQHPSSLSYQIY